MNWKTVDFWLAIVLVIYLLIVGIGAIFLIVANFPSESGGVFTFPGQTTGQVAVTEQEKSTEGAKAAEASQGQETAQVLFKLKPFGFWLTPEQGLALLAFLAGVAGSFLHAAQSLSTYIGNRQFRASWTMWYFLRPWIGGIIGFALYFAIRAGIVSGSSTISPYVVVAFGLLGGWFSKTATDKLKEVFETLFQTKQDEERGDKLTTAGQASITSKKPILEKITPSPVPAAVIEIAVEGENFQEGAVVFFDDLSVEADFVSTSILKVVQASLNPRPHAGVVKVRVKNPVGNEPLSEEKTVVFQ
jgi:hypothetical protein